MAGDWIKMRNDLVEDPAVIDMAAQLDVDEFAVIGRLHALWAWADRQSRDGHAVGVTKSWIDRKVQRDGFATAMCSVGWLEVTDTGIAFPNFANHNGESAKTRALGTVRKQKQRSVTALSNDVSRTERDKSETREEKRREEINKPPKSPKGEVEGFDRFWSAYPNKVAKPAAIKAFAKVKVELTILLTAIDRQKRTEKWTRDGGQYIPMPATWLNNERWNDEAPAAMVVQPAFDPESRSSIEAEGVAKGIGAWDELKEQWHSYKARVRGNTPFLGIDALAGMAARRQGAPA